MRIFAFTALVAFTLVVFFVAMPVMAEEVVQTPEQICRTILQFDDFLDESLVEECVEGSSETGVPFELLAALEQRAYEGYLRASRIPSGSWTIKVLSSYLGANGTVFHNKATTQGSTTLFLRGGIYVNGWGSTGLDNMDFTTSDGEPNGFDDELDLTVGWTGEVKGFTLDIGGSYYVIADPGGFSDVFNLYAEGSRLFGDTTLYLRGEAYFPTSGSVPADGQIFRFGVRRGFEISKRFAVSNSFGVFYDTGAFGFESGFLAEGSASLDWKLGPVTIGAPYVGVTMPVSDLDDGREFSTVVGVTMTRTF